MDLILRFPDIDHCCCSHEQDRGRCCDALSETAGCGVLVKLGDMGVCVNPGQSSRDNLGVKRFAPECNLGSERKLTEKVIFITSYICKCFNDCLLFIKRLTYSALLYVFTSY